jgi:hypothetical protein
MEKTLNVLAAVLAIVVCLAAAAVAQGSQGRYADTTAPVSSSADSFCGHLQDEISAQRIRFSGWRCKQGPDVRGHRTILAWVELTRVDEQAHLVLIWLAETQPAADAPVLDIVNVPHYGYESQNVKQAFRSARVISDRQVASVDSIATDDRAPDALIEQSRRDGIDVIVASSLGSLRDLR